METIGYVAPSPVAPIDDQVEWLLRAGVREGRYIRVDRPNSHGPLTRDERDFVFAHMLRRAVENPDGQADRLMVVSLDVLADTRSEVMTMFKTLYSLGVPLISLSDRLFDDLPGTEYTIRWTQALERADRRWRRHRAAQQQRKARRRLTVPAGRPPVLTHDHVKDLLYLRDIERITWPMIVKAFEERGIRVGQSTLRRYYAEAASAAQED